MIDFVKLRAIVERIKINSKIAKETFRSSPWTDLDELIDILPELLAVAEAARRLWAADQRYEAWRDCPVTIDDMDGQEIHAELTDAREAWIEADAVLLAKLVRVAS